MAGVKEIYSLRLGVAPKIKVIVIHFQSYRIKMVCVKVSLMLYLHSAKPSMVYIKWISKFDDSVPIFMGTK